MRFYIDTEFIERGPDYPIQLVSIGIVAEDGREFYRQADWFDQDYFANEPWLKVNVAPHLVWCDGDVVKEERFDGSHPDCPWRSRDELAREIIDFMDPKRYGKPKLYAWYADYDHVVFCQIFGRMIDLPDAFPMYTRDLKQTADRLSIASLTALVPQQGQDHHALNDARWVRDAYNYLKDSEP